jgi:WD40 repeat protein
MMMTERDLFIAALQIEPAERTGLLDRECAHDPALRQRIERLLAAHAAAGSAFGQEDRTVEYQNTPVATAASDLAGAVIGGRYKLLERIGEGGMGAVWLAEQSVPVRRKVALKLVKPGMDSASVLARFEAERQALALMDHPNIAKVLDGGLTDNGRPYFVMEYVKGVPITEYCDAGRLTIDERLRLFAQVCQAVQHAHQKGIIHRDLKPSNVLVAPYDDHIVPKVIDFGLAKAMHQSLTERTLHTAHEVALGTPIYMSPEQAQLNNLDIDTRSDIYSLGVLLYELLTGTTPLEKKRFKEAAWDEIRRIIREEEPPRPSTRLSSAVTLPSLAACRHAEPSGLARSMRGDLDWIVMKALEKDRTRRYETANAFAADVLRHLSGEPVLAVPPSAGYRIRKFVRRHRTAVVTVTAFALLLVIGAVVSTWQAIAATRARAYAERQHIAAVSAKNAETAARMDALAERDRSARIAYASSINLAQREWADGNAARARSLLNATRPARPNDADLRGFEWHYLNRASRAALFTIATEGLDASRVVISPEIEWIAIARDPGLGQRGDIQLVDMRTRREIRVIPAERHFGTAIALNPTGGLLASCSEDNSIALWDTRTGAEKERLHAHKLRPQRVEFGANGNTLVSLASQSGLEGAMSEIKVWTLTDKPEVRMAIDVDDYLYNVTLSHDGQSLAAAGTGLRVWDVSTGKLSWTTEQTGAMTDVAFSPLGRLLVGSSFSGWIGIWDAAERRRTGTLAGHRSQIHRIVFRPDGKRLASAGRDQVIRIWDMQNSENAPQELRGHESEIWDVAYSKDGSRLASASMFDGVVHFWDPGRDQSAVALRNELSTPTLMPTFDVAFNRDGRTLAAAQGAGSVQSWDLASGSSLFRQDAKKHNGRNWVVFHPQSELLATLDEDRSIVLLSATSGERIRSFVDSKDTRACGAFSPDGRFLVTPSELKPLVHIWDVATGRPAGTLEGHTDVVTCLAFSPDGRTLASGGLDDTIRVWDFRERGQRLVYRGHSNGIICLAFDPNRQVMASADASRRLASTIHIWDASNGQKITELAGHSTFVRRLAFMPGGNRLASLGDDGVFKLWDLPTRRESLVLDLHRQGIALGSSPDGNRIATSGIEGKVIVLDGTPLPANP